MERISWLCRHEVNWNAGGLHDLKYTSLKKIEMMMMMQQSWVACSFEFVVGLNEGRRIKHPDWIVHQMSFQELISRQDRRTSSGWRWNLVRLDLIRYYAPFVPVSSEGCHWYDYFELVEMTHSPMYYIKVPEPNSSRALPLTFLSERQANLKS